MFNQDKKAVLALIGETKKLALEQKASVNWKQTIVDVVDYYKTNSPPIWQAEFVPLIKGVYNDVGNFWANELGIAFNIRNIEGELALDQYSLIFANFVSETSSNEVKAVLSQGLAEGWSIETMINHLDDVFDHWTLGNKTLEDFAWMLERKPLFRQELIARTETTRAANQGAIVLYDKWGILRKEWLATADDRTRDTHLDVNGQVVNIDTPFTLSNGIEIMQPGDSNAPLSETAACRCTVLPIIPKGGLK